MTLRILLADDHTLVRSGVRAILERNKQFLVCGEAANGNEAVERSRELHPDLVILDLTMPVMDGFEAARKIKDSCPQTSIVVLTMHASEEFIRVLQKIGVSGYVKKTEPAATLLTAIDVVRQKQTYFPAGL